MKSIVVRVGLALALVLAFMLALQAVALLFFFHDHISSDVEGSCEPARPQNLNGMEGDGQVTLTWGLPADNRLRVKSWSYRRSQGYSQMTHDTGSTSTSHVVVGLTNGVPYSFQVKAVLESGPNDCWSNRVTVTPTQPGNVMEAIENHQRGIAANTSTIAANTSTIAANTSEIAANASEIAAQMVDNGAVAKELGERGAGALEALARSASAVATESARLRNNLPKNLDGLSKKVDEAGKAIVEGLAGIEAKLDGWEPKPVPEIVQLCDGENVGRLYFDHDSYSLADDDVSRETLQQVVEDLRKPEGDRLVLVAGYASAVGFSRHNLHLSDLRALCAVRCLRDRLGRPKLAFREIAMGEAFEASDGRGNSRESRRVDVVLCPEKMTGRLSPSDATMGIESADMHCGCPA